MTVEAHDQMTFNVVTSSKKAAFLLFLTSADEDCECSQVVAAVLATYFKQIGCTGAHNGHLLDRCATFNAKDKTRFSVFGKSGKRERVCNDLRKFVF